MSSPEPQGVAVTNSWAFWAPVLLTLYSTASLVAFYRVCAILTTPNRAKRRAFPTQFSWHVLISLTFWARIAWLALGVAKGNEQSHGMHFILNRVALMFFLCALTVMAHHWLTVVNMLRGQQASKWCYPEMIMQGVIVISLGVMVVLNIVMVVEYNDNTSVERRHVSFIKGVYMATAVLDLLLVTPFFVYAVRLVFVIQRNMVVTKETAGALQKVWTQAGVYTICMLLHLTMYLYMYDTGTHIRLWLELLFTYALPELLPASLQMYYYWQSWQRALPNTFSSNTSEVSSTVSSHSQTGRSNSLFSSFGDSFRSSTRSFGSSFRVSDKRKGKEPGTLNETVRQLAGAHSISVPIDSAPRRSAGSSASGSKSGPGGTRASLARILTSPEKLPPLVEVLTHKEENLSIWEAFQRFLANEYAEENLLFYITAEDFIKSVQAGTATSAQVRNLVSTFIEQGSPREVNISAAERSMIMDLELQEPVDMHALQVAISECQFQILQVLRKDSYPRFVKYQRSIYGAILEM